MEAMKSGAANTYFSRTEKNKPQVITMKSKSKFHRLLLAGVACLVASSAYAGPGPQYWRAMTEAAQFKKLQPGDKVAFVCYDCKTISEIPIQSAAQAEAMGKVGSTVTCPTCKRVAKVIMKGSRNEPSGGRTVILYVNEKGE